MNMKRSQQASMLYTGDALFGDGRNLGRVGLDGGRRSLGSRPWRLYLVLGSSFSPSASCPLLGEEASATCPCSHDAVPHHRSRNSSATVMD